MRVIRRKFSSVPVLALLTPLLFLVLNGAAGAQATSRPFAMGLYVELSAPSITSTDADMLMFGEGQPQPPPPALTIMKLKSYKLQGGVTIATEGYDWSRVVAVLVDEPYLVALHAKFGDDTNQNANPSRTGADRMAVVIQTAQQLSAAADAVKAVIPYARFWVNFNAQSEVGWMMDGDWALPLNQPYIDVISLDDYWKSFSPEVQSDYNWIAAHRATPYQQMALIPGTFYRSGVDSQDTQAGYIPAYFNYANNANLSCNLPVAPRGLTGIFDGCPIWMVLGFDAVTFVEKGDTFIGEPDAPQIAMVWRPEVALPVRTDLAHQRTRKQIVSSVLMQQWVSQ